jgi:prepilin-type N-terminal cleavage/methylation domain-containing protein
MKRKAFTLIELLIVVAVIGILVGFIFVRLSSAIDAAKDAEKQVDMASINKALLMYKVENGSYPIEVVPCTVGQDCTNLDVAIADTISRLSADLIYIYQSIDGSDYELSTVLSNTYSYNYSPLLGYSTNSPIGGICGSADGSNIYTAPTENLCSVGTESTVSGSGPWTWTCSGSYGGSTASCLANFSLDGACGSASGSSFYNTPTENLCSSGTVSTISGTGPWTWNCNGAYGGVSPTCAANLTVDGSCGTGNNANLSSQPTANLCSVGTASSTSGSGPWSWTCTGVNNGAVASCATGGVPVNGTCGSNNGTNLLSAPTTNLCSTGTASSVSGSGPWSWTCTGAYTGSTASCSATYNVNGVCGSANSTVVSTAPTSNFCSTGTASSVSGSGPWSWTCSGINSGTPASCSAALGYSFSGTAGTGGYVSCTNTSTGAAIGC